MNCYFGRKLLLLRTCYGPFYLPRDLEACVSTLWWADIKELHEVVCFFFVCIDASQYNWCLSCSSVDSEVEYSIR